MVLLFYDSPELDLARDVQECLGAFGLPEVELVRFAPELGAMSEDREKAALEQATGVLFLLTPGCERFGPLVPSPGQQFDCGWLKSLLATAFGRVAYLVDRGGGLPTLDLKGWIEFDSSDHHDFIRAVARVVRYLRGAPFKDWFDRGRSTVLERLDLWRSLPAEARAVLIGLNDLRRRGMTNVDDLFGDFCRELQLDTEQLNAALAHLRRAHLTKSAPPPRGKKLTRAFEGSPPGSWGSEVTTLLGQSLLLAGQKHEERMADDFLYAYGWSLRAPTT